MTACGESTTSPRQLDAAVDRAGVHEHLARAQAAAVDLVAGGVLAQRRQRLGPCARAASAGRRRRRPRAGRRGRSARRSRAPRSARDQRRRADDASPSRPSSGRRGCSSARRASARRRRRSRSRAVERAEPAAQRVDVEQRLRRVLVLAVAGVDDRRGRPARDQRGGAGPRLRMTIASGLCAPSVRTVSFSDSPFSTLEPLAAKFTTSALRRLAASSKDERVRVEAS